jgi:hypothetical protein
VNRITFIYTTPRFFLSRGEINQAPHGGTDEAAFDAKNPRLSVQPVVFCG